LVNGPILSPGRAPASAGAASGNVLPPFAAALAAACRPFAYELPELSRFPFKFSIHGLDAPKSNRPGQRASLPSLGNLQLSCQDQS
jgi:hypothetical protein